MHTVLIFIAIFSLAPPDTSYRPLAWTDEELACIQEFFPGQFLIGEEATEESFRTHAPVYDILHLATHAITDERNPLRSKLILAGKSSSEDDQLHAYEIYNLKLNASLAVLSACNTGTGKVVRGEGVMSLARSFVYAGCPSVVMSLWSIDDKATGIVVQKFYEGLAAGLPKDKALRDAKLYLIHGREHRYRNPYYWAGLVQVGDPSPLSEPSQHGRSGFFWLLAITMLLSFLTLLIYKKNKVRPDDHQVGTPSS